VNGTYRVHTWVISEVLHTVCFLFKMDLFYKVDLQASNVIISILLYHSGPTFGLFLYSCLDTFVVDASDTQVTSLHTSSMLLKRFPWSGFFNFGNKSQSGGPDDVVHIFVLSNRFPCFIFSSV
jgi:hypothetical protein